MLGLFALGCVVIFALLLALTWRPSIAPRAASATVDPVVIQRGARMTRAVTAVGSGDVVNPDGIRNQIEDGNIQSASWTLCERVQFDSTRVTSRDWGTYPILPFPQVQEAISVHIVDRPGDPFLGTGSAAQGPTAAAIANALADACGRRLRELPFSRARGGGCASGAQRQPLGN